MSATSIQILIMLDPIVHLMAKIQYNSIGPVKMLLMQCTYYSIVRRLHSHFPPKLSRLSAENIAENITKLCTHNKAR